MNSLWYTQTYSTAVFHLNSIFMENIIQKDKAVLKFKSGAFYPGVAIQPMLLRPRAVKDSSVTSGFRVVGLDTLTWTMYQNWSPITCMWLTLCQFTSHWTVRVPAKPYILSIKMKL